MKFLNERVKNFLLSLDEYSLVYHKDSDGVCSASLLTKFLKEPKLISPNDMPGIHISNSLIGDLNKTKKIIFTDLPLDQMPYEKIKKDTLVIDHHSPSKNLNAISNRFIHINPRFKNPDSYIPASCIVYKILEEMKKDVKKYSWIAGVGIVGDRGTKNCRDVIRIAEKYDDKINIEELNFLSDLIEASRGVKGIMGISEAYKTFSNAENPKNILDSKLMNYYNIFQKEINQTMLDFRYHSEFFPETNSYLYKNVSRYNIESVLSTKISEEISDSAVFVYKIRSYMFMSARCQTERINVGNLMKKLSEGLGSGGGHPQAAAATVPREKAKEFLDRLRKYLEGVSPIE